MSTQASAPTTPPVAPLSPSGPARRFGTSRRAFLAGAGAAALGVDLLADASPAVASGGLTPGDAALLRFAAAAEILETDFWQQYNELGGIQDSEVPGGSGSPLYTAALEVLDSDMAQYVHDNTEDRVHPLHVPQRLPGGARRRTGQPGSIQDIAEQ